MEPATHKQWLAVSRLTRGSTTSLINLEINAMNWLDENLGERGRQLLDSAGHDVCTVPLQGLATLIRALEVEPLAGRL